MQILRLTILMHLASCCSLTVAAAVGRSVCFKDGNNGLGDGILHQLIHSLGFFHENSQSDRSTYLSINVCNIIDKSTCHAKFWAYSEETYGQPYDFGSIMHLSKYEFSEDQKSSSFNSKYPYSHCEIGQREGLSPNDQARINSMYPLPRGQYPVPVPTSCPARLVPGIEPETLPYALTDKQSWNPCKPYFGA
ncbi:hypothetical protein BV898_15606 [Hypsibius exemplaris]|uniref:Metalloendopeptidase n=1 Tax=Hypsibius exemplaris TaxID=2072580 RepID=A0A9X6NBF8_HYPEX|nr:hypothetical protein BV898_15606 [Hypsibius exemplaris]